MNVDGMHFFPFAARGGLSNDRGLLAVNNEYTDEGILHHDTTLAAKNITLAQARTSQAAHGVSVIEVRAPVTPEVLDLWSPHHREYGLAAGHDLMKTAARHPAHRHNRAAGYTSDLLIAETKSLAPHRAINVA